MTPLGYRGHEPSSPTAVARTARIAGAFYLGNIVTIFASILLLRGMSVPGDVTATAGHILDHLARFRLAFALQVLSTATSIVVAALLYQVFKPVDAGFSLTATLFRLLACGLAAVGYVFQLAPLALTATPNPAFSAPELHSLAATFIAFQVDARNVSIAFFACQFNVLAYLIARSTFLPRLLAAPVALAGVGGLVFAASPAPAGLLIYFAPLGLVAELSLALWLATVGVRPSPLHEWRAVTVE